MFVKVTRSGPRRYLQIVETFRDPDSGRPKQRHISNLGRLEQLTETDLDGIINTVKSRRLARHADLMRG